MSTINVVCFSHVGITVSDLDASLEFYGRLFGFERLFDDVHDDWRRVGLRIGDVQLELFSPARRRGPSGGIDPYYPMPFGAPKIARSPWTMSMPHMIGWCRPAWSPSVRWN